MNLETLTNAELLTLWRPLAELRRRGVVHTANAPAGDLAERLVADAMGGELATNAQKSWDVLVRASVADTPAQRVQVKARVVTDPANASQRQVSAFRSWDCESVMFVLFDPLYRVRAAALVPTELVRQRATYVTFTASDRVFANDAMLTLGENWTERLQNAGLWAETRDPQITDYYTVKEHIGPMPRKTPASYESIQHAWLGGCRLPSADDRELRRGLPMIGPAVSGAIPGSDP